MHTNPRWLDREKLGALGFDVSVDLRLKPAERHYQVQPPRAVFVALELGGDAYREYLAAWRRLEEEAAAPGEATPTAERRAEIERELAAAPG